MFEKSKRKQYSVEKVDKFLANKTIRIDHPDQRLADQWVTEYRDNLIADALAGNPISPIVICEQFVGNAPTLWLIDGKQRCTNFASFRRGLFKLGSKIDRPMVEYVHVDNSGDEPVSTVETFDIRKKRYADLPKELKDRYDMYEVEAEYYMDCTDDDIDYHIKRYNRAKPMTAAQKGTLYLGTETNKVVKRLAQHGFFRDEIGNYSPKERKNGSIDRVITESLMAINFLPSWKKQTNALCAYLRDHVSAQAFDQFEGYLDRLDGIVTEDIAEFFDNKNSFIFFTLFHRFAQYGMDDDYDFAEFLRHFKAEMMDKEVNGDTYTELSMNKATKDKPVIERKLNLLETLMCEFLHIDMKDSDGIVINDRNLLKMEEVFTDSDIVKEVELTDEETRLAMLRYVSEDLPDDELQSFAYTASVTEEEINDAALYLDMLRDWCEDISIINSKNISTLLRIVMYGLENDMSDKKMKDAFAHMTSAEAVDDVMASLGNKTAA